MEIMISMSALAPSQYRKYVKGWDKGRYADTFKKFGTGNAYRVYIPVGTKATEAVDAPEAIVEALEEKGYTVEDYRAGIALSKDGKRRMRIGKLIANDKELKRVFDNDDKRKAYKSQYVICISRHPYDVVGASTDRGWSSCMDLTDGSQRHHLAHDVKAGTIIAYLIDQNDMNIKRPTGRVMIKPFYNAKKHMILRCEDEVYGTSVEGFIKTVQAWLDVNFNHGAQHGLYEMDKTLYADGPDEYQHIDTNSEGFWESVQLLTQSASDRHRTLDNRFTITPERRYILSETKTKVLTKLDIVTSQDIVLRSKSHPAEALKYLHEHDNTIAIAVKHNKKAGKTIVSATLNREELMMILVRVYRLNSLLYVAREIEKLFKPTLDEISLLLEHNSRMFRHLNQKHIDMTELMAIIVKRDVMDSDDQVEILNGIADDKLRQTLTAFYIDVMPNMLTTMINPPMDKVKQHWAKIGDDLVDSAEFYNWDNSHLIEFFPIVAAGKKSWERSARSNFVSVMLDTSKTCRNEDLMRELDKAMSAAGIPDWIHQYVDGEVDISGWSEAFIRHLLPENKEEIMMAVMQSSKFKTLREELTAADPLASIQHMETYDLSEMFLDAGVAESLFAKLAATDGVTSDKRFWDSLNPNLFSSIEMDTESDEAIRLFELFVKTFPIVLESPQGRWLRPSALLNNSDISKHVMKNYPWMFGRFTANDLARSSMAVLTVLTTVKTEGTPEQKKLITAMKRRAKTLINKRKKPKDSDEF